MVSVLCLCVHNSARSQMAEAYFRKFGGEIFEAESAGLEQGKLNPFVVLALSEEGADISGKKTQDVFELFKAGKTSVLRSCTGRFPILRPSVAQMKRS